MEKENQDILSHEKYRSSESEDCEIKQTHYRNKEQSTTPCIFHMLFGCEFWM
jgi:hypothetical protein